MPALDDETFGPVAAISRVPNAEAAIAAANASQFGLSGDIWSQDIERA
jgi:acyl-CoA reductase-like NAD-dependent aldehyde dehydrogenase